MKISILYLYSMIGAVWASTIVTSPRDTTGTIGGTAMFVCEVDHGGYIPTMTWLFNKVMIYFYMDNQVDYPLRTDKYVVSDSKNQTIFTLEVRNLSFTDGGNYICKFIDQEKSAALIVLGSPVITHEPTNFTEGIIATYTCEARFGGPSMDAIPCDYHPQMMLFLDTLFYKEELKIIKEFTMQQIYEILVDDSMDNKNLKCEVGTTTLKHNLVSSTIVNVPYSVRNITYSPQEDKYEFGSNITCSARGNPIPLFEWRNRANPKMVIKSQVLHIASDMEGKNSWTCTASNSVGDRMHEEQTNATFEAVLILQDKTDSPTYLIGGTDWIPQIFLVAAGCLGVGSLGNLAFFRCRKATAKIQKSNVTASFYVTTLATVFGSSVPHGWSMGVLNIPQKFIKKFIDESFTEHYGFKPSSDQLELLWALCVSIYLISGCFGIFIAGKLADKFGRKHALLFCYPFEIIAAISFVFCKMAHSFELLIVGRLINGFFCGAGSRLVLMYLTDIAPGEIQDEVLMLDWFGITLGILLSQIAGLQQCLGTESLWPYLLSLTALPTLASLLILPCCSKWPMDHLMKHKENVEPYKQGEYYEKASTSFNIFYKKDTEKIETEKRNGISFETYYMIYMKKKSVTVRELFQSEYLALYPCLIILWGLNLCQRFSGIYIVFYYSLSLFEASGVPQEIIEYCVLSTGVINVLTTGVSIVGDFEHRLLLLIGMSIMIMSSLLITLALHLKIFYISIISINTFVLGFALGFGSVTTYIARKLFFAGPRTPAITVAHSCNWFFNFIVALVYPVLQLRAGPNSFWIFTSFLVIAIIFVFVKLPDTKGKSMRDLYKELGIEVKENWPIDDEKFEEVSLLEIKEHHQPEEATTQPEDNEHHQPEEATTQPEEIPLLVDNNNHEANSDTSTPEIEEETKQPVEVEMQDIKHQTNSDPKNTKV